MEVIVIENRKELFVQFHKSWTEVNAAYERYARGLGISYSLLQVLCELYNSETVITQKYICEKCYLPKTTVNSIILGLIKQAYAKFEELPDDRRQKAVSLTDMGRDYAKPIMSRMSDCEMEAFEMLDEDTLLSMLRGIEEYQKHFNEKLNDNNGGK